MFLEGQKRKDFTFLHILGNTISDVCIYAFKKSSILAIIDHENTRFIIPLQPLFISLLYVFYSSFLLLLLLCLHLPGQSIWC